MSHLLSEEYQVFAKAISELFEKKKKKKSDMKRVYEKYLKEMEALDTEASDAEKGYLAIDLTSPSTPVVDDPEITDG
jgi:dimeric dUTPase (all-alpha-NTP-PPase superfamily)